MLCNWEWKLRGCKAAALIASFSQDKKIKWAAKVRFVALRYFSFSLILNSRFSAADQPKLKQIAKWKRKRMGFISLGSHLNELTNAECFRSIQWVLNHPFYLPRVHHWNSRRTKSVLRPLCRWMRIGRCCKASGIRISGRRGTFHPHRPKWNPKEAQTNSPFRIQQWPQKNVHHRRGKLQI